MTALNHILHALSEKAWEPTQLHSAVKTIPGLSIEYRELQYPWYRVLTFDQFKIYLPRHQHGSPVTYPCIAPVVERDTTLTSELITALQQLLDT